MLTLAMPKKTSHGYRVKCNQRFNVKKNQLIKIIAVDNWYGTINVLSRKKKQSLWGFSLKYVLFSRCFSWKATKCEQSFAVNLLKHYRYSVNNKQPDTKTTCQSKCGMMNTLLAHRSLSIGISFETLHR